MNNDRTAQDLYMKLISMGKELNDIMTAGGIVQRQQSSEYELMQRDLENNPLVRDYSTGPGRLPRLIEKDYRKDQEPGLSSAPPPPRGGKGGIKWHISESLFTCS